MRKINSQVMKSYNALSILKLVRQNAPISRTELVQRMGLTSASVINITNEMLQSGLLAESGRTNEGGQGRKSLLLDVRPDAAYVIGVHLSTESIITAVSDLSGSLDGVTTRPLEGRSAQSILDQIKSQLEQCLTRTGVDRSRILGVGLSLPGPLDIEKGIMINPPNFPGLAGTPIRALLESQLQLPVCCDRETNNAVLAEFESGCAAGYKTAFFISLFRTGVGGGVIANGNILHGFCDSAGEIGHTTVDIAGPRCSCGSYGCLEALVSEQALLGRVRRLQRMNGALQLREADAEPQTLEELFRLSQSGDEVCTHVVNEAASYISIALGNAINLYSPEIIVLGGTLPQLSPQLVELIRRKIHARTYPHQCSRILVVPSSLGDMAFVRGAAAHAWERFLPGLLGADTAGVNAQAPL
ncbi:MAG: ROK family protein [Oscillospiraceae bacterium]